MVEVQMQFFIRVWLIYLFVMLHTVEKEYTYIPIIGTCSDCVNIHGMESTSTGNPPPLTGWELLEKDGSIDIVPWYETTGKRKIDPAGFYQTENNLALFYNSSPAGDYRNWAGHPHSTNQDGSLIATKDMQYWQNYEGNPVFNEPQYNWQGRNRTNPYALVWHPEDERFYTFYGDFAEGGDNAKYPGRRALGVAASKDMVHWEYLTKDEPLFHINHMAEFAPDLFADINRPTRNGRVYAFGAVWHEGYIYLAVGGSADGTDYNLIVRSKNALEGWERVEIEGRTPRPMPIYYDGKWYSIYNMRAEGNPDGRAIGLEVADEITGPYVQKGQLIDIQHWTSAGHSRQLFMVDGTWYIAFRVVMDEENNRTMRIARAK